HARRAAVADGLQDGRGAVVAQELGVQRLELAVQAQAFVEMRGLRERGCGREQERRDRSDQLHAQIPAPLSMARSASSCARASASIQPMKAFTCGRRPLAFGWTT